MINKETSGIKSDPSCETRTDILCEFSPKPYGKKTRNCVGLKPTCIGGFTTSAV